MSTRQTGNRHENEAAEMAEALGYAVWKSRGSRGTADLVCFQSEHVTTLYESGGFRYREQRIPPLVIQVGTAGKPIAATLADLQDAPRPIGSRCLVARRTKKRAVLKSGKKGRAMVVAWKFHAPHGNFDSLAEAIA